MNQHIASAVQKASNKLSETEQISRRAGEAEVGGSRLLKRNKRITRSYIVCRMLVGVCWKRRGVCGVSAKAEVGVSTWQDMCKSHWLCLICEMSDLNQVA